MSLNSAEGQQDFTGAGASNNPIVSVMTAEEDEAQRKLFNAADADMDDQLTDEETIIFLKGVIGENPIDDECL